MAQHDLNIANQSFPNFRSDLNNSLVALGSQNSGSSAPSSPQSGMIWIDTTTATAWNQKFMMGVHGLTCLFT